MLVHLKSDLIRQRIHAKEHAVSAPKKLKHSAIFNANHHTQSDVIMLDKENYYAPDSISPSPKPGMTRFFLSRYYVFFFIYFLLFSLCLSYFSCIYSFSYANLISFVSKLYFFLFNPFYWLLLIKIMHHLHYLKGYIISCSLPCFFLSSNFIC